MKRYLSVVGLGLAGLTFVLSGCETSDRYSAAVKYGLRKDPLVKTSQSGDLGDDVIEPDRPGALPLLHRKDVLLPENPMHPKGDALFTKDILRDPTLLPDADKQNLDKVLTDLFGTPAEPKVAEISDEAQKALKLDAATLKEGSRLYRIHCLHCHGVPGDGRGPTSRWISPHPRDFRQNLFKFMSVDQTNKTGKALRPPRRDDLLRTVRHGLEGTAMPAFLLLDNQNLNDIVSYVIHLSLRGKAEFDTITGSYDYDYKDGKFTVKQKDEAPLGDVVKEWLEINVKRWVDAQSDKALIEIPAYNEKFNKKNEKDADGGEWQVWKGKSDEQKWRIRGAIAQMLFNDEDPRKADPKDVELAKNVLSLREEKTADVKCRQCHADYGRQAKFKFDMWGTLVRPNNFTAGVFRGGRRPADIYHRVHSGISGSNMTPFGDTLSSNSIWDMVEFVQVLSYPAMRKKMGIVID